MLSSVKLELKGELDYGRNDLLGSLLHGFIMENIDKDYASYLHKSMLHPYSQYIISSGEKVEWVVNTLDVETKKHILDILKSKKEIYLRHKEKTLQIISCNEQELKYDDLVKMYYIKDSKRQFKIRFLTPTSFKQNGKYCIFPTTRLIFQSLMMKFDNAAVNMEIFSKDILEDFENCTEIIRYNLRSTFFHLEGVKIPAFIGEVIINVRGPQQLSNLANMLIEFGTYSGVGIKTGMGMGGISTDER